MQEYDATLKLLLKGSATLTLRELTGATVTKWLDVELPRVQNQRLDLLGEAAGGGLVHLELQSSNDSSMALRMAEYSLGVFRRFGQFPRQVVLYVGEAALSMQSALRGSGMSFAYTLVDIRSLDGDRLLESDGVGDCVIAILAGLRDHKEAVHKIVERIAALAGEEKKTALTQLTILAGLRHLWAVVDQETKDMPIDADIREHEYLGPLLQAELQKGRHEGRQEGERTILRRQLEKRFGELPSWASQKLESLSARDLEDLADRLLDAQSLDALMR